MCSQYNVYNDVIKYTTMYTMMRYNTLQWCNIMQYNKLQWCNIIHYNDVIEYTTMFYMM